MTSYINKINSFYMNKINARIKMNVKDKENSVKQKHGD